MQDATETINCPPGGLRAVRWSPGVLLCLLLAPALSGCTGPAANDWAAQVTQIDALRHQGYRGTGVRVAILDTGIDVDHPSLAYLADGQEANGELAGYVDFLGLSHAARDDSGHGTFLAGVLAGHAPDGVASWTAPNSGVAGLAPGVTLLVGRVCSTNLCSVLSVWKALEWALEQDADIISLSLGFTPSNLDEQPVARDGILRALQTAQQRGVLVVAAAGNTDGGPVLFPAREPTVLAVGAMDRDGQPRASSARGFGSTKPDLVAPGEHVIGPQRGGGRIAYHGTSAAVPFVVATAALLMERYNPATPEFVTALRQALVETASPLDGQRLPHDPWAGHGLLQGEAAKERYGLLVQPLLA